jgi:hypothetical protein
VRHLSHRARRKARLLATAILGVSTIALLIVLLPSRDAPSPDETRPSANAPAAVVPPPDAPKLATTLAVKREIVETARTFIESSVRRVHPERSFELVHPSLRQSLTRAQWKSGNIPVIPFPAVKVAEWKIDDARVNDVLMEVVLVPRPHSGLVSKTFLMELKRSDPNSRWLVASWAPYGVSSAQMTADQEARGDFATPVRPRSLSELWLILPLSALGLIVLAPIAVLSVDAHRGRSARLRYERDAAERADRGSSSITRPS